MKAPKGPRGPCSEGRSFEQDLAAVLGGVVAVLAVAVMAGWLFDVTVLKSLVPGFSTMKFNTALGFVLGGLSLKLQAYGNRGSVQHWGAFVLACVILALGAANVAQYLVSFDLGIDQFIVRDLDPVSGKAPGRMSLLTAAGFCVVGLLLSWNLRGAKTPAWPFTAAATASLAVPFLVLVGYLYGVRMLYSPTPATSMAIHTALCFAALIVGAVALRPDSGWHRLLGREGTSGELVGILFFSAVIVPPAIGWVTLKGHRLGLYGAAESLALSVLAAVAILLIVLWVAGQRAVEVDTAFRRQEVIHSAVLESSPDAFVMTDADGVVFEWNKEAERTFGVPREEAIGHSLGDLAFPEAEREWFAETLQRYRDEAAAGRQLPERRLTTAVRSNGEEFPAEATLFPVTVGSERLFSSLWRDVSAQKALEARLAHSQRMEAIGQLTGGVAHDFNNLLTVILGNLELLREFAIRDSAPLLRAATTAAERGADLIRRLLAAARRQSVEPRALDLNAMIQDLQELLNRTLGDDIDIRMDLEQSLPPIVADPAQVESVVLNLALNASQAMRAGGKLTIETANVRLDQEDIPADASAEPGDFVALCVTDTGTGISPAIIERVFEPFFTTKESTGGSGLGLSMAHDFAAEAKGIIKIHSEPGLGTTVRLYLPSQPSVAIAQTERRRTPMVELRSHGETILVVDDDADVRAFAVGLLRSLGYQTIEAGDPDGTMRALLGDERIDLLFADISLPGGMTGWDLAETAISLRPGIRVLLTSGFTANSALHQGKLEQGAQFVAKPYKRETLAARLRKLLDTPPASDSSTTDSSSSSCNSDSRGK